MKLFGHLYALQEGSPGYTQDSLERLHLLGGLRKPQRGEERFYFEPYKHT